MASKLEAPVCSCEVLFPFKKLQCCNLCFSSLGYKIFTEKSSVGYQLKVHWQLLQFLYDIHSIVQSSLFRLYNISRNAIGQIPRKNEKRKEDKNSETKLLFSVSYKTVLGVKDVKINLEEEFYYGSF